MAAAKKGAAPAAKKKRQPASSLYEIAGEQVKRKKKTCPKCGPSYFLADHTNRNTCGKCGYTEFKNK